MSLQIRFGIAGAVLGLVIGLTGSMVAGVPIGILLLRTFVAIVVVGVLGFVLYFVIKSFLPELLLEDGAASAADELAPASGHSVNITLPEEGYSTEPAFEGDQAEALRQVTRSERYGDDADDPSSVDEDEDGMIEEVSEDRRSRPLGADSAEDSSFNEAAFYEGVDRLPDIGGFSEQFQPGDEDSSGDNDSAPESGGETSRSAYRSKGGAKTNMDPALIAKAIQTALKKDDL